MPSNNIVCVRAHDITLGRVALIGFPTPTNDCDSCVAVSPTWIN